GPRQDRFLRRLAFASAVWLSLDFIPFALWQFLDHGWPLNYSFYFSSFLLPTLFCLTASVAVLIGGEPLSRRTVPTGAAVAAAVLAPVLWIYRGDSFAQIANGYADGPYIATFAAMGITLLLAVLVRVRQARLVAAAAVVGAFFAVSYGLDSSRDT